MPTPMSFIITARRPGEPAKLFCFEADVPDDPHMREYFATIGFQIELEKNINDLAQQQPSLSDDEIIKSAIELASDFTDEEEML